MKRRIEVIADSFGGRITITATIDNKQRSTRKELEQTRDELADALQSAASNCRWIPIARSRVRVR